ncbi:hypothetical protein C2869_07140 [Saccharobesus litoralis]|uniref:Uncharacterized protein n=1 Tax=Saccharobesus litoralis TaxID=2172099 RepID=A0A2S0VPV4_9ALTE|nr:hypothetical protein [Saccharobesus litoralis]AWB66223.1 hypothetical protein C2869_07140 [Saccharobesus litoralis]
MLNLKHSMFALFAFIAIGCNNDDYTSNTTTYTHQFSVDSDVWTAGFADYPVGEEQNYELTSTPFSSFTYQAHGEDQQSEGHLLSGVNYSDDLFMYIKAPLDDLKANQAYAAIFYLKLAVNYGPNCTGIGGSPSDSVYIKAGIGIDEPVSEIEQGTPDMYRMNWDIGSQANDGDNAVVLGTATGPNLDCSGEKYQMITSNSLDKTLEFTTDENGQAWILLGIDSGFEGKTSLYLSKMALNLIEID